MMEITKADWKLFRSRIAEWQEGYMERLIKEYVEILNGEGAASDKFRELEKRIKNDKRNPGVFIELHKQDVPYDLVRLINLGAITVDDLEGFSEELKGAVNYLVSRNYMR